MFTIHALKDSAISAVCIIVLALFLSSEDIPYAHLQDLNFLGWMLISIGIFAILAIAHLIFLTFFLILVRLPTWFLEMAKKDSNGKG